jgi:hypothetical protein
MMSPIPYLPPRDSKLWYVFMALSFLAALAGETDQIDLLLPTQYHDLAHALIRMSATGVGIMSGWMRMSTQGISAEGRRKAIHRDTKHLPKASIAAAAANVASAEAAVVMKAAAKKAEVAEDLAKPGAA